MSAHRNGEGLRVVNYDVPCGSGARKLAPGEVLAETPEAVAELDDLVYVNLARRYLNTQRRIEEADSEPHRGSDHYLWMLLRSLQGKKLAKALGFDYRDRAVRDQILPEKAQAIVQSGSRKLIVVE